MFITENKQKNYIVMTKSRDSVLFEVLGDAFPW